MLRVGLTYDLRDHYRAAGFTDEDIAEFDSGETIDAIDHALRRQGHVTERIGTARQLAARLVAGDRWDLVFNIAEGLVGIGREAQVPALLDAYAIPYTFSDPSVMALALHKAMAKRVVRDAGLPTTPFAVVEDIGDIGAIDLAFPLFAKPLAEGTGKGITPESVIATAADLDRVCRRLLGRFRQPVLVEPYLPGREFTVGILGAGSAARPIGVLEVVLEDGAEAGAYSYLNKEQCETRVQYRLAADAEAAVAADIALAAWKVMGCRDAGRVDFRSDGAGRPMFLEVNPLAGLHPTHSDLPILCELAGIGYDDLIGCIMQSAVRRAGIAGGRRRAAE